MHRTTINAAGTVATLASASGAIYCAAHGGSEGWGWASTFAVYGAFAGLCWRWALKINAEAGKIVPAETVETVPLAAVDPFLADLNQQIAEAVRLKRKRVHLYRMRDAHVQAVLAGRV